ncbi:hypothetical protein HK107_09125 [Parvularcula sp. ZS-1/3]|uniref:AMP-binding protein n=1 Tax=Parvularcula mediterranea TaxID=2732508 RepID=A0A7Y3RM31_9PROT|nr:hypothetical protein [Parvularcula mediterranea]NNU16480.1 hypothetical protein [Parvularcula mediterranea]
MQSFSFSKDQLVTILTAMIADELARRHQRYLESLVHSGWGADTKLGTGGVEMTEEQRGDCAARAREFFGHDQASLPTEPDSTIGDWADALLEMTRDELVQFSFYPTTQTGEAATSHAADDIFQDAAGVASLLAGRRRTISMVPPHSLLGLVSVVLAPNLQRIPVIDARTKTPEEVSDLLTFGDLVVATPTLWRYLAATLPEIPGNVVALSYGEALTMDLAQKLRQRGLGALRELYGSTESGVVGWRDSQSEPFTLFDHWDRDGEAIVRQRPGGRSLRLIPMDEVEWEGKRAFRLGERRDGAVQIGAVNVFPSQIAEIITEQPAVQKCEVRLSRRPGALDRLIADIIVMPGLEPDQDLAWSIDEWCRERLRPAERPRIYHFVPASEA